MYILCMYVCTSLPPAGGRSIAASCSGAGKYGFDRQSGRLLAYDFDPVTSQQGQAGGVRREGRHYVPN